MNYIDPKMVHLNIPFDLESGDSLKISSLWVTNFKETDASYHQPFEVSAKRPDVFSVLYKDNTPQTMVSVDGVEFYSGDPIYSIPSERSFLLPDFTIKENTSPTSVLTFNHINNICFMLSEGLSWDLDIPNDIMGTPNLVTVDYDNLNASNIVLSC
jgi:hypothetical protein